MSFLVDTDICSAYLKNHPRVVARFMLHFGSLNISAVTLGELMAWANRAGATPKRRAMVEDLISACLVLDIDRVVGERFGEILAFLLDAGRPVGSPDVLNACVALVHNLTVVTHNVADYQNVPGLPIVDWIIP